MVYWTGEKKLLLVYIIIIIIILYLLILFLNILTYILIIICIGLEPKDYEEKVKSSWIWSDLKAVRNVRPSFHTKLGLFGGMAYSGFTLALKGNEPWTLSHGSMYKNNFIYLILF